MKSLALLLIIAIGGVVASSQEAAYRLPRAQNPWYPSPELGFGNHNLKYEMQVDDDVVIAFEADEAEGGDLLMRMAVRFNNSMQVGWFGIGPTENGGMMGSNPCVIRDDGSGQMAAFAYHAEDYVTPTLNGHQNCELLEYNVVGNEAYALFRRPTVGCKPEDLDIHGQWEQRWIFAWHNTQDFVYHGAATRGTAYFNAFHGPMPDYDLPDDAFDVDCLTKPHVIPATRDVYTCRAFPLPSDRRYHVIRWDPVLHDISPASYHHMILYNCHNGIPEPWDDGEQRSCRVGGTGGCTKFFIGWAIGQPITWTYPAGMAVGAGDSPVTFATYLESHIDNPTEEAGILDVGWGLKLWMTPTLRDIESMVLGLYIGIGEIPPRTPSYSLMGECVSTCLNNGIPEDGIVYQGIAPHMHEIGMRSRVFIVRDGKEVPALHRMDTFDPAHQGLHAIHPDIIERTRMYPGDRLLGVCTWDSSDREDPTYFGEGFGEEMCTPFINLYPAMPFSICQMWPGHEVDDNLNIVKPGSALGSCDDFPWVGAINASDTWEPLPPPPNNCPA